VGEHVSALVGMVGLRYLHNNCNDPLHCHQPDDSTSDRIFGGLKQHRCKRGRHRLDANAAARTDTISIGIIVTVATTITTTVNSNTNISAIGFTAAEAVVTTRNGAFAQPTVKQNQHGNCIDATVLQLFELRRFGPDRPTSQNTP
jgi:hypothetical protein